MSNWPLKASLSGLHAVGENPAHMKCSINGSYVTLVTYFITQFMITVEKNQEKTHLKATFLNLGSLCLIEEHRQGLCHVAHQTQN